MIKGINNETIITPMPLKSFSFSLAAEINTPIMDMKKITPEMVKTHPYTSVMILLKI